MVGLYSQLHDLLYFSEQWFCAWIFFERDVAIMTPPTIRARKGVAKIIQKWRPRLFLGEWYIDVQYPLTDMPCDIQGSSVLASNHVDTRYLKSEISVYPAFFKHSKDKQEETIVHELAHCLTQEVWDLVNVARSGVAIPERFVLDVVERLTTRVANVAYSHEWNNE